MIKNILELLKQNEFHNVSENIEVAKGKYLLHDTFRGEWKQRVRQAQNKLKSIRNGR